MDAEQIRDHLARIDWNLRFDPVTLRRANAYLKEGRLHLLSFNCKNGRDGVLNALVHGNHSRLYHVQLTLRPQGQDLSLAGACDCPAAPPCKHIGLVLLFAQMFPPEQWPRARNKPAAAPAAAQPKDTQDALPAWLRKAVNPPDPLSLMTRQWDSWLAQLDELAQTPEPSPEAAPERQFALILRPAGNEQRLTVLPAFLRPSRNKKGGLVDPQPLRLDPQGPTPTPPGGWSQHDALALSTLLSRSLDNAQAAIPIDSAHCEAALLTLLQRHPAYWERTSTPPLQAGPELPARLEWQALDDGAQKLDLVIDDPQPAILLHAHRLWYVQPEAGRWGPVAADARLPALLRCAPLAAPEVVPALRKRLGRKHRTPITAPAKRRLRRIAPTPVPVLYLYARDLTVPGHGVRGTQSLPLGVARLRFEYDGLRLDSASQLTRIAQGEDVLEITHDPKAEQAARTALEKLGGIQASAWVLQRGLLDSPFSIDEYLMHPGSRRQPLKPEEWETLLPHLQQAGFKLEFSSDFPHDDVVQIDAWHARIDENEHFGSPWFDVSLGIEVEGQTIDLLPILRQLLATPDFPLRKPANEAADASWRVRIDAERSVRLPLARLRAMLEPLLEWVLASDTEGGLRLHRTQAAALQQVVQDSGLAWQGQDRLRTRLALLQRARRPASAPPGFRTELRGYQRDGLAWLDFLSEAGLGGILADDMGLGKTVQVLAHLLAEKARGRLDHPALVVAPTSLVGNWRDEAARFAPDLRVLVLHGADRAARYDAIAEADLVITTYPLLPRDRDSLCAQRFSLLVLDEAQAIKNARSLAAQVVRALPARRRLAMTGTPLENHLGELWAQFDAVEPGLLGSQTRFNRHYRNPIEKHADSERQQRLNQRIGALLLRRRKEDVLAELPPKTESVRRLELSGSQRQLYETLRLAQHERVRQSIAERGLAQSGIVVIDALLKLRQACCDPRLVKLASARKVSGSVKLEALLELIQALREEGRRILVFSQFTQMLALIAQALDARKQPYLSLTGDTPSTTRSEQVRRFQQGEVPVFLISLKAGGVGLNLTAADAVIHYDPWWNPAAEAQATDRAHRMGQDKPVFVYKLICAGTVEEKILAMQARKAELARAVLEGGSSRALRFDERDLAELFAPL